MGAAAEATRISAFTAAAVRALCFAGLAAGHSLAGRSALVSDPALALRLLVVCEAPLVITLFSCLQRDAGRCSFLNAADRGLLGLPVGGFLNVFCATALGAVVEINLCVWSIRSRLADCILSSTPTDALDSMISVPAYGAVIGAWFGAWPIKEWPICVTYGAVGGHLIGMVVSLVLIVSHKRKVHAKDD